MSMRRGVAAAVACGLLAGAGVSGQPAVGRLSQAIQSRDAAVVRALLQKPGAASSADADGTTPLHWAVRLEDVETARLLLAKGAKAEVANRYGVTPLTLAAGTGHLGLVELLLGAGANARAVVFRGQTVLMTAARTGNAQVVARLLDKGADPNAREDQQGETALMWAASENHADVVRVLAGRGADVNARSKALTFPKDRFGLEGVLTILPKGQWTPLMYAARDGGVDAARALVAAGAAVNVADPDGTTPLVRAIWNAHYDTARVLLEAGADPNILDTAGMGALYAAVDMSSLGEVYGMPPRRVKDATTPLDLVSLILDKGGVVDAKLKSAALQRNHTPGEPLLGAGTTPLMRAARHGDSRVMRALIAKGADASAVQPNGTTVLMLACGVGRGLGVFAKDFATEAELLEGVRVLLGQGVNVNAANTNGMTALHFAAQAGMDTVVSELAGRGATLDAKDKQGRTPVDVALGVGNRGRAGGPPAVYEKTAALIKQLMSGGAVAAAGTTPVPASAHGPGPGPASSSAR